MIRYNVTTRVSRIMYTAHVQYKRPLNMADRFELVYIPRGTSQLDEDWKLVRLSLNPDDGIGSREVAKDRARSETLRSSCSLGRSGSIESNPSSVEDAHDGMTNPGLASKRIWHGYSSRGASRMVEALSSAWLGLTRMRLGTEMSVRRAYEPKL